jgi:hypothetical protein
MDMTDRQRRVAYAVAACGLAPVVIFATPHSGDQVAYLVPLGCVPIPALLAERWPSPWSIATVAVFGATLGVASIAIRRAGAFAWWRSTLPLFALSLAGSALLVASFALLGSRLIALIWSGLAAATWGLVLLFQTRGVSPGAPLMLSLLRIWLVGGVLLGLFSSVFGVLTGLCC